MGIIPIALSCIRYIASFCFTVSFRLKSVKSIRTEKKNTPAVEVERLRFEFVGVWFHFHQVNLGLGKKYRYRYRCRCRCMHMHWNEDEKIKSKDRIWWSIPEEWRKTTKDVAKLCFYVSFVRNCVYAPIHTTKNKLFSHPHPHPHPQDGQFSILEIDRTIFIIMNVE